MKAVACNPFKPNRISHRYHLKQTIFFQGLLGEYFYIFFSNFDRTICQQTVKTHIRRRVRLFCNVCLGPMSYKKDTMPIRVNLFSAEMNQSK